MCGGEGGGGFISGDKWNKITDPLNIHKGKAGKWADPLGLIAKKPAQESAADRAARLEAERQAKIAETQGRINEIFDNPKRAAEIADVVSAVRDRNIGLLNEQRATNARNIKFSLARGGQTGGSLNRDLNTRAVRDYDRGVLGIEQGAQGVGARLSAADQDARARLISLATTGLDSTSAAAQSAAALRSNLEANRSEAMAADLADSFGSFKNTFTRMQEDQQRRRGLQDSGVSLYGSLG